MTTGIKVTKTTKDVSSTDIRDFILHSEYPMFKIHTISSDSITINAGESGGTTTISHNLGYVPAFLVYEENSLFPSDIDCYATTTGITITKNLGTPYNQITYNATDIYNENGELGGDDIVDQWFIAGYGIDGDGSAVRFNNIALSQGQSIVSASFEYKNVFTSSGADILFKIWGIDEDNTADFAGGSPMGRPKTTAYNTKSQSQNTNKFNFGDTWTSLCQEIVDRSGWSSGNAMGFLFNDNGTTANHWLQVDSADRTSSNVLLNIVTSGSVTYNYKVVIFKDKIHS